MEIQAGNTAVFESLQDINKRAVERAVKAWDMDGNGSFQIYVSRYVNQAWYYITKWN